MQLPLEEVFQVGSLEGAGGSESWAMSISMVCNWVKVVKRSKGCYKNIVYSWADMGFKASTAVDRGSKNRCLLQSAQARCFACEL